MKTRKYLKRTISDGKIKPIISWGFHFHDDDGRRVCATADGYRIHLVWDDDLEGLEDGTIPFSGSRPFSGGGLMVDKMIHQIQTMLHDAVEREYECVVQVDPHDLKGICSNRIGIGWLTVLGNDVLLSSEADHALYQLPTAVVQKAPEAAYVGFNLPFFRDAVYRNELIDIRFTTAADYPMLLGKPGTYASLIMPISWPQKQRPKGYGRRLEAMLEQEWDKTVEVTA